ncbi:protein cbp-1-like isoform X2 [Paramacrobiotus metropolitanus]|uniref:protein cbp-1-like isoform X2 n=1 Tax=Paramacrobiotus metropolitanus TaxID=2943436 RepID=UPI002445CC4C|nr:protein cbp-1-like isoform X2 [Paramacrobiotus metropolitanus]
MNDHNVGDGPVAKKARINAQDSSESDVYNNQFQSLMALEGLLHQELNSSGSSNARPTSQPAEGLPPKPPETLTLNGLLDAPPYDPHPPSNQSSDGPLQPAPSPQRQHPHQQLSQLLAKTPHSQPMPTGMAPNDPAARQSPINHQQAPPPQQQQPMRQSPHLPTQRTNTPGGGMHGGNLGLTTNGFQGFPGGPGGPPPQQAQPQYMNGPMPQPNMPYPVQQNGPQSVNQMRPGMPQRPGMPPQGLRPATMGPRPGMVKMNPGPGMMGGGQMPPNGRPMIQNFQPPVSQINMNPMSPMNVNVQNAVNLQPPPPQGPGVGTPQGPGGGPNVAVANQLSPPSVDHPEKRKIIQQQLVLLLHAHKCQRREMQTGGEPAQQPKQECKLPHCRTMKNVLTHMTQCVAGKQCPIPHCASSRQIIQHWKTCTRGDCPVCLPLKQASDRNKPAGSFDFQVPNQGNVAAPVSNALQMGAAGGGKPLPGGPGARNMMVNPQVVPQTGAQQARMMGDADGLGVGQGLSMPGNQMYGGGAQVATPLSNLSNSNQDGGVMSPPPPQGSLPGTSVVSPANTLISLMSPPSANSPLANNPQFGPQQVAVKEWHLQVVGADGRSSTDSLRNHLIHKLVQAIFPYKDQSAVQDKRMTNLISYARKVEAEMYEQANTREEYYQLLAEKIYKIQKELEEKRRNRQELRRVLPGQPPLHNGVPFPGNGGPLRMRPPGADGMGGGVMSPLMGGMGDAGLLRQRMQGPGYQNMPMGQFPGMQQPPYQEMKLENEYQPGMMEQHEMGPPEYQDGGYPPQEPPEQHIKTEPLSGEDAGENAAPAVQQQGGSPAVQPNSVHSSIPENETVKQEENAEGGGGSSQGSTASLSSIGSTASPSREPTGPRGPVGKKVHPKEELLTALSPIVTRLYNMEEGMAFRVPVNPQELNIPDYFDIIKNPMDLSTMQKKLEAGDYEDPWQFIDDMYLMFNNAWIYNRKGTRVYKHCSKLAEVFEVEIDPVMQTLGYCCGHRYVFQPQVLCCYGKQLCTIPRDTCYMSYQDRYTYCQRCFADMPGETVTLGDDPSQPNTVIRKECFAEKKNDTVDYEPYIVCKACGRKNHQICALHLDPIWPEGYTCEGCLKALGKKRRDNRFSAKKLPQTKLGQYIEAHINSYLQTKNITDAGEVTIRVLSSSDKVVEVKPGMKHKFADTNEFAESFPYKTKAIFAFEEIDGTDVCFFGMHVQEYGSDCPAPNARRIYIAYLDSVHFFRPKHVRTAVYHEILLSYINYCKNLGYSMAHIWACPPSEGDDYVFHCHPPEQKIPKPKRLQEWYKKMLDKGMNDKIILEYKDIYRHSVEDAVGSATELPYFEGDFWPNVLEECIKEVEQLELKEKEERQSVEDSEDSDDTSSEPGKGKKRTKKSQSHKKQRSSKQNSRKSTKKVLAGIGINSSTLTQKIFQTMDKHKDVFFVIRLHPVNRLAQLPQVVDPDPLISCELMDGRDAFLTIARDKHYEFSSLRRAKFSSMAMLFELHNQGQDRFVYTCNSCKNHVETRWHCSVCDDYDLCVQCYEKDGHPHKMDRLGFGLDDDASSKDAKQTNNPQEARLLSIQRCIQSLMHASQCRDANCRLSSCQKMKRVLSHTKTCKRKSNGQCPICKQLIALCCYHAKQCNESKCLVPFCPQIRAKWKLQRQQQDIQRQQFNRRRAAIMQRIMPGTIGATQGVANVVSVPSPQPTVSLGKGGQGPPMGGASNALQETLKNVQAHAQFQVSQGKALGGKPTMGGKPTRLPQMSPNWTQQRMPGPPPNVQLPPQAPGGAVPPGGVPPGPRMAGGGAQSTTAYQQLVEALQCPPSQEQQQRVRSLMQGNPELITGFLKMARTENRGGEVRPNMAGLLQQQMQQQQQQAQGGYRPVMPQQSQSMPNMQQQQQQPPGMQQRMQMYGQGQPGQGQFPGQMQQQQQPPQPRMAQTYHPNQNVNSGMNFNPSAVGGMVAPQGGPMMRQRFGPSGAAPGGPPGGGGGQPPFGMQSMGPPATSYANALPSGLQQQQQLQQQAPLSHPPGPGEYGGGGGGGQRGGPPGGPMAGVSIRSPAAAAAAAANAPVRSPQAPSPQTAGGRPQSTPRPLSASPSPRPLAVNLHPSGYEMAGGDLLYQQMNGQGGGSGGGFHGNQGGGMPPGGGGPGNQHLEFSHAGHPGHHLGGMPGGYHHHPTNISPQDQLNKFVEGL